MLNSPSHASFNDVPAPVYFPGIRTFQLLQGVRGNADGRFSPALANIFQKIPEPEAEYPPVFPLEGKMKADHVQAEEEVFSESPLNDFLFQIFVGAEISAHPRQSLSVSHTYELSFLNQPGEASPESWGQVPISSRNTVPREPSQTGPFIGQGPREGPFDIPKSSLSIRLSGMALQLMVYKWLRLPRA